MNTMNPLPSLATPVVRSLAVAAGVPAPAPAGDTVQTGARPEALGYNPTRFGVAAMLGAGVLCSAGILTAAAALIPGGAGLAAGSALAAGFIGMGVTGVALSNHAAARYQETGLGTAFMQPAFQKADLGPLAILSPRPEA